MAQADHRHAAVALHAPRQADERVGEIHVERLGAVALHIFGDVQHQGHVAGCVGEGARAAIFGVGLAQAVFEGNFPVQPPDRLALTDLHGHDHEVSARQCLRALRIGVDAHLSAPLSVHFLCQLSHQLQIGLVNIDKGELCAAQTWTAHDCGERTQPENGAARADDDDLGRFRSVHSLFNHLNSQDSLCRSILTGFSLQRKGSPANCLTRALAFGRLSRV